MGEAFAIRESHGVVRILERICAVQAFCGQTVVPQPPAAPFDLDQFDGDDEDAMWGGIRGTDALGEVGARIIAIA